MSGSNKSERLAQSAPQTFTRQLSSEVGKLKVPIIKIVFWRMPKVWVGRWGIADCLLLLALTWDAMLFWISEPSFSTLVSRLQLHLREMHFWITGNGACFFKSKHSRKRARFHSSRLRLAQQECQSLIGVRLE